MKTIKIFLKKKKTKSTDIPVIQTENYLYKMNLVKKKKNANMHLIYIIIFQKEKKDKTGEYAHEK